MDWKKRDQELNALKYKYRKTKKPLVLPDLSVRKTYPSLSETGICKGGTRRIDYYNKTKPDSVAIVNSHKQSDAVIRIEGFPWTGQKKQ